MKRPRNKRMKFTIENEEVEIQGDDKSQLSTKKRS
jgi:hypothetical protein